MSFKPIDSDLAVVLSIKRSLHVERQALVLKDGDPYDYRITPMDPDPQLFPPSEKNYSGIYEIESDPAARKNFIKMGQTIKILGDLTLGRISGPRAKDYKAWEWMSKRQKVYLNK